MSKGQQQQWPRRPRRDLRCLDIVGQIRYEVLSYTLNTRSQTRYRRPSLGRISFPQWCCIYSTLPIIADHVVTRHPAKLKPCN